MIGGESLDHGVRLTSSGIHVATWSSSPRAPSSRSPMIVAAVKLLVIEAIRNGLSASGTSAPPARRAPRPPLWTSSPSITTP